MSDGVELIYSQQATRYIEGRAYSNPRFFSTPRAGVSKVLLVGDWPKIRAAYEALGVPVEQVELHAVEQDAKPSAPVPKPTGALPEDERSKVYIPDDWSDLAWTKPAEGRDLTLRGLAAMFSDEPVINKAGAVMAIEAELRRRANHDPEAIAALTAEADERGLTYPDDPTRADLVAVLSAAE